MFEDFAKIISFLLIIILFSLAVILFGAAPTLAYNRANLVKTNDNPAVYAIISGKKHIIPNENIFTGYGYKWEDIKTISQKELSSYPNAKLVKIDDNPVVYYLNLDKKLKKAHPSAEIFLAYGNKWKDIITISEKNLNFYANANLVKTKNNDSIYFLEGHTKRLITSPEDFTNSGYKWENVIEISDIDLKSYQIAGDTTIRPTLNQSGTPIEKAILNISWKNSGKKAIPDGTIVEFAKINISSAKDVSLINGITLSAKGLLKDNHITRVYLTDEENKFFNEQSFVSDKKVRFNFQEPLLIEEGETKSLTLKAKITKHKDHSYQTIGFGIENKNDIKTDNEISSNFPIWGELKQLRSVIGLAGNVKIEAMPLNYSVLEINTGAKNQILGSFEINETSGNENILITRLAFYVEGVINYSDLINIDLVDNERNKILETATWMQKNRTLIYDLKYPLEIDMNSFNTISLQADVVGIGEKTFRFMIDKDNTIAKGKTFEYELQPKITNPSLYNKLKIKKGDIMAFAVNDSPNKVITGEKNALLGIFELRSPNMDLEWEKGTLSLEYSGTALSGELSFVNVKTKEKFLTINASALSQNKSQEIHPAQFIKAGAYLRFEVRGNISKNASKDDAYSITLSNFKFKDTPLDLYDITNESIDNTVKTYSSSIYIIPEVFEDDYIAGAKKVKIGKFTIQSNHSEDIYIKGLSIKSQEGYDALTEMNGFYNVYTSINRSQKITPHTIPVAFDLKRGYRIRAGSSLNLEVYADTYPIAADKKLSLAIANINASGKSSNVQPTVYGLNTNTNPIQFSSLDLELEKNENFGAKKAVCGEKVKIGSFILRASGEDIKLKQIILETTAKSDDISYSNGFSNLTLMRDNRRFAKIPKPLPNSNAFKTSLTLKKNDGVIILDVYADISECCDCEDKFLQVSIKSISGYGRYSKVNINFENTVESTGVVLECECEE